MITSAVCPPGQTDRNTKHRCFNHQALGWTTNPTLLFPCQSLQIARSLQIAGLRRLRKGYNANLVLELSSTTTTASVMQRIRTFLRLGGASYKPLNDDAGHEGDSLIEDAAGYEGRIAEYAEREAESDAPFSILHYAVFMLLGVAMLWAWCVFPSYVCIEY
jgi:hypothetical protein